MKKNIVQAVLTAALAPVALSSGLTLADEYQAYAGYKGGFYEVNPAGRRDNSGTHGAFGGYRLHKYIAAEAEYLALRKTEESIEFGGNVAIFSVNPTLPLGDHWKLFTKVGWAWVDAELTPSGQADPGTPDRSVKDDTALLGIGTAWDIGRFHARIEYQFDEFDSLKGDLNLLTVGFGVNF